MYGDYDPEVESENITEEVEFEVYSRHYKITLPTHIMPTHISVKKTATGGHSGK
jgi:hypothetical protein